MPIVRRRKLTTLDELCLLLRRTSEHVLCKEVVEAMTTNETLFFRDLKVWQALRTTVLPELIARRADNRGLRIWSAASSSGQEAYSTAMVLLEMGLEGWRLEVRATDLSECMVKRARDGRYSQLEVGRGLPARCLIRHFARVGMEWEVKQELRELVHFEPLDLRTDLWGLGQFDLVMCRNVLIYFDIETKKKVLSAIRCVLNPGGYLLLGAAETTLNLSDSFEHRNIGGAGFYAVR